MCFANLAPVLFFAFLVVQCWLSVWLGYPSVLSAFDTVLAVSVAWISLCAVCFWHSVGCQCGLDIPLCCLLLAQCWLQCGLDIPLCCLPVVQCWLSVWLGYPSLLSAATD